MRSAVFAAAVVLVLVVGIAWARQEADKEEQAVRRAAFAYYSSTILGEADECLKSAQTPLVRIRDGKAALVTADALRKTVHEIGKKANVAGLPQETRRQLLSNMFRVFDDADIRFIGASTATVVFLVRPAAKKGEGDWLGELVLTKTADNWRVVGEITDTKPAPPMPDVPEPRSP